MELLNLVLHIDSYLRTVIEQLGPWSYVALFGIIFAETGLVVTPFLPGDSLLFAAGALAGGDLLNIWIIIPLLLAAAILGDTANYWIGHKSGEAVFTRKNSKIFKPAYLKKTHDFYERYGGKTIIIARFIPIVRTFAPFVAGVGRMRYRDFLVYNVLGACLWVIGITLVGYMFGNMPVVKHNFELVIISIIAVSLLPAAVEFIKHKRINR
jgi:membrane-associated protein